jgi:uncharacterized protein YcfJ
MNKLFVLLAAMVASGLCAAQEVGRVISTTPLVEQVGVPRQVCSAELVNVQRPKSGAGAAMGAIAGGAMGNAVGGGAGKAAATAVGILGGAIIGDNIEGAPPPQLQNVQRCNVQTFYESRTVGFNVVYEYAGKQYTVLMPQDPGPTIKLQISPIGAMQQTPPSYGTTAPPPIYGQAPSVVVVPSTYPGYFTQPYYPPITLELGYRYWGGHRDHRHNRR